jgi:alpha-L-fucosidase
MDAPGVTDALQHGDRAGTVWRPAEVDVSIRPGWFYHAAEDEKVRTVENLESLYFSSVGRNGKLLLNVPPTRDGLLHSTDVARLAQVRARLTSTFEDDFARDARRTFAVTGPRTAETTLDLGRAVTIGVARLEERIARGQRVARYTLYGSSGSAWRVLSAGSTIGYTKLDRFEPVAVRRLRLSIEDAADTPVDVAISVYGTPQLVGH